ncbi:hypothetical protein SH668x_001465 [Planctomicrobium sp. SH668]|uniref:hypothetical protein n=1 Tax=Planctomicrobium sp. SH668 TaxID=3448126 RepID=UPI003F5B7AFA
MISLRSLFAVATVSGALMAGCGGGSTPDGVPTVKATVVVTVDGKPVDGKIDLRLTPPTVVEKVSMVRGAKQPDGKYVLETYRPGDGAPPGTYNVSLASGDMADFSVKVPSIEPASLEVPAKGGELKLDLVSTGKGAPTSLMPNPHARKK